MPIVDDFYKRPVMTKEELEEIASPIFDELDKNYLPKDYTQKPELANTSILEKPVFAIANPQDDFFYACQEESLLGPRYMLPGQWLPAAMSVITYFFPYTEQIKKARMGQTEGQEAVKDFGEKLSYKLMQLGYASLVPANDIRYEIIAYIEDRAYGNWSEYHAASIAGLSNLSATEGLVQAKDGDGCLGSIITLLEIPADTRPYDDPFAS